MCSDKKNFPGIFYFYVGGGSNHYGYMTIRNQKLFLEDLWEEDYTDNSPDNSNQIKELSSNKDLIAESKEVFNQNRDMQFIHLIFSE